MTKDYLNANDLEAMTGTPASTWRYWAHINFGPPSQKIGRRRVWRRDLALEWLQSADQAG
jgi:DNA-binding transcriptional MerR regulator